MQRASTASSAPAIVRPAAQTDLATGRSLAAGACVITTVEGEHQSRWYDDVVNDFERKFFFAPPPPAKPKTDDRQRVLERGRAARERAEVARNALWLRAQARRRPSGGGGKGFPRSFEALG